MTQPRLVTLWRRSGWAVGAFALVVAVGGVLPGARAETGELDPATLPNSMHGAVETQAMTLGNGAVSLFVDPGTAYAYSTVDYTRLGDATDDDAEAEIAMKAVGAVANPGTIVGAVIWAAPICEPQPNAPCTLAPTGLHEASGFPGYAEALYPTSEGSPNREHVRKCILNKDADGANPTAGAAQPACAADAVPAYAGADTTIEELSSRGFTRVAGASGPGISVGASEALSDVRPVDGNLASKGYASVRNVDIAGVVKIEAVKAAAEVVAGPDADKAEKATAACTFEGLTIADQEVKFDPEKGLNPKDLEPLLAQARALGYDVDIIPPPKPKVGTTADGKHFAECEGLKVFVTDINPESRVSSRNEFTFGFIKVSQAASRFDIGDALSESLADGAGAVDIGGADAATDGTGGGGDVSAAPAPGDYRAPAIAQERAAAAAPAAPQEQAVGGPAGELRRVGRNLASIGGLTAATIIAIGFGVWLLTGVVMSLAYGAPLRLPRPPGL